MTSRIARIDSNTPAQPSGCTRACLVRVLASIFGMYSVAHKRARLVQAMSCVLMVLSLACSRVHGQQYVWQLRTNVSGPAPSSLAMAYDASRDRIVAFGGYPGFGSTFSNATWEYDSSVWLQRNVTFGPGGRNTHAMAYDSARGVTTLFGGTSSSNLSTASMWEWNGITWTEHAVEGPSPRTGCGLAYDAARGVTVLFGGSTTGSPDGPMSDETWEWNGSAWTRRLVSGPSPRWGHRMSYDSTRHVVVLFGGSPANESYLSDTWEWNGAAWSLRASTGPSSREFVAMTYDPVQQVTLLFGGYGDLAAGIRQRGDTWKWDGMTWSQLIFSSPTPSPRDGHAMSFDLVRGAAVMYGGVTAGNGYSHETWDLCSLPNITSQPIDVQTCQDTSAMFSVAAFGSGSLSYEWQIERPDQVGIWDPLTISPSSLACGGLVLASSPHAATTGITIVAPCPNLSIYRVRCIVSGPCDSTESSAASLVLSGSQTSPHFGGTGYYAALGTLPTAQGWTEIGAGGPISLSPESLSITSGNAINGFITPMAFRWSDGHQLEARVRVPVGDYEDANDQGHGLRAEYMGGGDETGQVVWVWLWSAGVALSTNRNASLDGGLAMMPFDAASMFHTYLLTTNVTGATLSIDGIERLSLPYWTLDPNIQSALQFGNDSRETGIAISEWMYVQFDTSGQPADLSICPNETATFSVEASGSGPIDYEWQIHDPVSASGTWIALSTSDVSLPGGGTAHVFPNNSPEVSFGLLGRAGEFLIRCVASNACGGSSTASDSASLTVLESCCDSIDFNQDSLFPDTLDIADFLAVFSGGVCDGQLPTDPPCNSDIDYNNDTLFPDTDDIDSMLSVFSGGPCL